MVLLTQVVKEGKAANCSAGVLCGARDEDVDERADDGADNVEEE